jgi:peptidoglycan/LPS O-acetylase OafA/YrhL
VSVAYAFEPSRPASRIAAIDGVRALSILLVMAGHLIPLGPKPLMLNGAAAGGGMALFFILSGYLITRFLDRSQDLIDFLTRRFVRILPLAWLYFLVLFIFFNHSVSALISELTFTLNYRQADIGLGNGHIWSLCVEMQFYVLIGLLYRLAPRQAPYALLLLMGLVTALKVAAGAPYSMLTHLRGDEILAGSALYSSQTGRFGDHRAFWRRLEKGLPFVALAFFLACNERMGVLQYGRGYLAGALVGAVLVTQRPRLVAVLTSRPAVYIAEISYALYIFHGGLMSGWFSQGSKAMLYGVKRPVTIAASFALAHVSTRWYEPFFSRRARAWLKARSAPRVAAQGA